MKRVLITGGTGFLGQALLRELQRRGCDATAMEGDIRAIHRVPFRPDTVFHLAAVTGDTRFETEAAECFDINVTGTQAVIDFCAMQRASLVFASTSGLYEMPSIGSLVDEDAPVRGSRPYALSKLLGERLCRLAVETRGLNVTVLRLFNIYGPGQRQPFLVPYIVDSVLNQKPMQLRMPEAVRDFVNVRDAVDAFLRAAEMVQGFQMFNIGSGIGCRVMDVVMQIEKLAGKNTSSEVVGAHAGEPACILADNRRAQKILGWSCRVSLEDGLREIMAEVESK